METDESSGWSKREAEIAAILRAPDPIDFTDTAQVLEAARSGDAPSFERLWQRFLPGLCAILAGKLHGLTDARLRNRLRADLPDMLQDIWLNASAALAGFEYRGSGSMLAWLRKIAINEFTNRLKFWQADRRDARREREVAFSNETFPGAPAPAARVPGPRTSAELDEQRLQVGAALESLDPVHRELVCLKFYAGASWSEIAECLGLPGPDAARMECKRKVLPALAIALSAGS